jgi:hypothetical protein
LKHNYFYCVHFSIVHAQISSGGGGEEGKGVNNSDEKLSTYT